MPSALRLPQRIGLPKPPNGARSLRLGPFVERIMEILERIWEIVGAIANSILGRFERGITSLFGSANARFIRRQNARVEAINALEQKYQTMSDEELWDGVCRFVGVRRVPPDAPFPRKLSPIRAYKER